MSAQILESPWLSEATRQFLSRSGKLLIGNKWADAAEGGRFWVKDPTSGQDLIEVARATAIDVDRAVLAAGKAFEGRWSRLTPAERARLLWRLADLIEEHAQEFSELESVNTGKPITETMLADVPLTVEHFRYFAGWVTKLTGETLPVSQPGHYLAYTRREALGVVGAIVPWNFPLMIASWKIAPALACGNTVVIKPSEITPLSLLRLGELVIEAGFPPGVINIVPGYGHDAGQALVSHPGVAKISFTGSTRVGREIMVAAADRFTRVTLELGGKSPNIVLPDANPDAVVAGAMMGIFFNQGEVCCAGSRLFLPRTQFDSIIDKVGRRAQAIQQGVGIDPATEMGALVSESQMNRVMQYIETGKSEGASLVTGGARNTEAGSGYFVQPTIFVGHDDMTIAREEIFGPVLVALPYEDLDEVVRRANATPYGLAAAVWTEDVRKGIKVAEKLKAGTVWINGYNLLDAASPWGGFKTSGVGREMGSYALQHYTEVKSTWVNLD